MKEVQSHDILSVSLCHLWTLGVFLHGGDSFRLVKVFLLTGRHREAVMESTESRFAHLLQPIRELTKNWDIDVASELNDYLEEVKPELSRQKQLTGMFRAWIWSLSWITGPVSVSAAGWHVHHVRRREHQAELCRSGSVDSGLSLHLQQEGPFKLSTNKTSVNSNSSAWTCVCLFQVELLHSLVYQTLEYINDKNKKWDHRQVRLNDSVFDKQL